jgi:surface antigen
MFQTLVAALRACADVRVSVVTLMLCLPCAPSFAQNWVALLKNTPAEHFSEEDLRLFLEAARKALNDTPAGETVRWENPPTGSRGELTVVRSFSWNDQPCREVRISNEAAGRKSSNVSHLCRVGDRWRAVTASQLKK